MAVVIKDVAKHAGLSVSVVSKYLKNANSVRDDTRVRIEAAIAELGYVPNLSARSLRTGRTNLVSVVVPDLTDPLFIALYDTLRGLLRELGVSLLLQTIDELTGPEVDNSFSVPALQPVDAVILCFPESEKLVEDMTAMGAQVGAPPLVLIHWREMENVAANIVVDIAEGIYQATKYLLEKGHRKISYIGGPDWSCQSAQKRSGFIRAVSEYDCLKTCGSAFRGQNRVDVGYNGAAALLGTYNAATAIVTESDSLALGCVQYCQINGLRIPEDTMMTGYGDTFLAMVTVPQLTSVFVPLPEICQAVVDTLSALWAKEEYTGPRHFSTSLAVRDSARLITPDGDENPGHPHFGTPSKGHLVL